SSVATSATIAIGVPNRPDRCILMGSPSAGRASLPRLSGPRNCRTAVFRYSRVAMTDDVRWGILGTAHIAERAFLPGLRESEGGRPVAVASRTPGAGEEFARKHDVERA